MKRTLFAIAFLIFITACPPNPNPTTENNNTVRTLEDTQMPGADANAPDYQWVQFGVDEDIIARAIYKKSKQNCPKIDTVKNDGTTASIQMDDRLKNTKLEMPTNFAEITVCEAKLSADLKSAKLAGKNLTIPDKTLERVIVMGDTGCRDAYGDNSQDCGPILKESEKNSNKSAESNKNSNNSARNANSNKSDWDFKETIKSAKGLDKTDFVIHVGDYVYRECDEKEECGNDKGRNWETWETDFFEPAAPLLASTPWVFTRGNHEDCGREYRGWFLFFDPRSLNENSFSQCNNHTDGFQIKLNGLNLIVLDSADEGGLSNDDVALVKKADAPTWLVTHVPLYGISHYGNSTPKNPDTKGAITGTNIKFLVSGHIHFFEMIQFPTSSKIPPQMVAGGGATKLDHYVSQEDFKKAVNDIRGDPEKSELIEATFTFAFVDFSPNQWKITVDDQDGTTEDKTFTIDK